MIRIREDDVFSPEELVQGNLQFRNRLMIGAAWRSDIVTAIEYGLQPIQVSVDGVKDRHVSAYEEFKSRHERVLDLVTIDPKSAREYLE